METKELMINEIMIGDWVDVRKDAAPNTPHIEKITPAHFLRVGRWFGVPLTIEILEKNGFIKEYDEDIIIYVCNYPRNIIIEVGENYKLYVDKRFYIRGICGRLYYVHNLQIALRLMGIEKEIIL